MDKQKKHIKIGGWKWTQSHASLDPSSILRIQKKKILNKKHQNKKKAFSYFVTLCLLNVQFHSLFLNAEYVSIYNSINISEVCI